MKKLRVVPDVRGQDIHVYNLERLTWMGWRCVSMGNKEQMVNLMAHLSQPAVYHNE